MKKNRKKNGLAIIFFIVGLIIYILGLFLLFGTTLGKIPFIKSIISHIPFIFDKGNSVIKLYEKLYRELRKAAYSRKTHKLKGRELALSHGDLCFSNILYSR